MSATNVHQERRRTAPARADFAAFVVGNEPTEPWIIWCETDYEADELRRAIPYASEVRGSHSLDKKEETLRAFSEGEIRALVTKPSIAGFGLNWQHCARVVFAGATFSFESFYQAIRRTWRFGQKRPVDVHVLMGETEIHVWDVLARKRRDHERMQVSMFAAARRAQSRTQKQDDYTPADAMRLPSWLREVTT